MKRGILYIVFGEEYDKMAALTIKYSQKFTDLPICVLTNVKERSKDWPDNIMFIELDLPQEDNRSVKTQMINYTPFDQTLYLDCDSVIRKKGIEVSLNEHDMFLHLYLNWSKGEKILQGYKNAFEKYHVNLPIKVYNGAFIGFNKNTKGFFDLWNTYWEGMGKRREMHVLTCALRNSGVKLWEYSFQDKVFHPDSPSDVIVQHNYHRVKNDDWYQEYGIPKIKEYKPFNSPKYNSDWHFVLYQ